MAIGHPLTCQKRLKKAEEGKIDYILTKSIARFSRSMSDTLYALHQLRKWGVEVYFLEQGFDTADRITDLILGALASIAEMESQSVSENVKMIF